MWKQQKFGTNYIILHNDAQVKISNTHFKVNFLANGGAQSGVKASLLC